MPRKTVFAEGHEEGYNLALEEVKSLTVQEFGKVALSVCRDSTIGHKSTGEILYKIHEIVKDENLE